MLTWKSPLLQLSSVAKTGCGSFITGAKNRRTGSCVARTGTSGSSLSMSSENETSALKKLSSKPARLARMDFLC